MNGLFINLSNHPSNRWSESQISSAIDMVNMGPVVDIPFPNIDPELTKEEVDNLSKEYIEKIDNLFLEYDAEKIILHVMGEMTFTYKIINHFKDSYIFTCVASTTKRNVVEKEDGTKVSVFEFVQFREY